MRRFQSLAIASILLAGSAAYAHHSYAATYDVNNVSTAILDQDHSQESRELISHIEASGRFKITPSAPSSAV